YAEHVRSRPLGPRSVQKVVRCSFCGGGGGGGSGNRKTSATASSIIPHPDDRGPLAHIERRPLRPFPLRTAGIAAGGTRETLPRRSVDTLTSGRDGVRA